MTRPMNRARTQLAPEMTHLAALEITHPEIAEPVRVINDAQDRVIAGETYVALRFNARIAADQPGRVPVAELSLDNVGREVTTWISQAQMTASGIQAVSVRVMIVVTTADRAVDAPDYDVTMDVLSVTATSQNITARLGFDPLLGRAAVALRHDPQTSPGLF